jgi:hypothetical protein
MQTPRKLSLWVQLLGVVTNGIVAYGDEVIWLALFYKLARSKAASKSFMHFLALGSV